MIIFIYKVYYHIYGYGMVPSECSPNIMLINPLT